MGQGGAAHFYGRHKLFDYARKRELSRAAARVGIDVERARNQGLKKDGSKSAHGEKIGRFIDRGGSG